MSNGNSNAITRSYLDSLLVETRYLDSTNPTTAFELYGAQFSTPIMTGALSFLDQFLYPGASTDIARGAAAAKALFWIGMAGDEEIERCAATGAKVVEIIKPFADRAQIYRRIRHAEEQNLLAVGIDIDHPYANDGSPDVVDGHEMKALTFGELEELCKSTRLPLITKGVLSLRDAEKSLEAGVGGMLLSHHNNRIEYAVPAALLLPEVVKLAGAVPVFIDGEISSGMDAFKALALGATAVGVGRPLMTALKKDRENGVRDCLRSMNDGLAKAMACTGCADLSQIEASILHRRSF